MRVASTSVVLAILLAYAAAQARAQVTAPTSQASRPVAASPVERARKMSAKAAEFLIATQDKQGGWAEDTGPGITCLVAQALAREPSVGPKHPAVKRAVECVRRFQRDDGGIYSAEGLLKNYETSVALSMFAALRDPENEKVRDAALKFIKDNQWDEADGKSLDDPWYGGAGYGHGKRPDLSNTQLMLDALHDSGLPKDDPAYRKALVFIQRCQMLGETNDQPFAKGSTDGGFIYSPANSGESKGGDVEVDGRKELRTYGSMTYAGFKSMLYCDLKRDDPRVRAALEWIRRNWTLDHNPNMPEKQSDEGLFYYYHTFARALAAWNEGIIRDSTGRERDWRAELVDKLAERQRADGSWVNAKDRWMEGNAALTTAYAMLALEVSCNSAPGGSH